MDFDLTDEQRLLQDTVGRFLSEKCPTERVRAVMESDTGHDADLWSGLSDLGVNALLVPAAHGGLASELLDAALVSQELGYACAPGPFLATTTAAIALAGATGDLGARWLPRLATGEAVGTLALGEAGGEWRPDLLQATARDGRLSGEKPLVLYARASDFLLVAARDESDAGLWLVEREAEGVEVAPLKTSDMTRRLDAVSFDRAPAQKIGGSELLARTVDAGLILVAADAYGGARRCLDMAVGYALEREQFGQVIGAFQGVKHQLADLAAALEPSLAFLWYAAHAFDRIPEQSSRHAAMAKAWLADLFDRTAAAAIELHGGIGFTWEFDLHLWFRRSIFDRCYLGDAALHRQRAAALAGW
jgi:alkylation response protein AidB-like acyl-CoA dehydrogenase